MIRLVLVAVFLILFLILSVPVLLISWLIGKRHPGAVDLLLLRNVQLAFKAIL